VRDTWFQSRESVGATPTGDAFRQAIKEELKDGIMLGCWHHWHLHSRRNLQHAVA